MKNYRPYFVIPVFLMFCIGQWAQAQTPVAAKLDAASDDLKQRTFEKVWRTVKDKHFDAALVGANWDNVRERYAPQVAAAKTDAAFYALLSKMIGELGQSHFYIVPPQSVPEADEATQSGPHDGVTGIKLQLINQQIVITAVQPSSPAAQAGLRTGFVITSINEKPVLPTVQKALASKQPDAIKRLMLERLLEARLDGASGTSVSVGYLNELNRPFKMNVARVKRTVPYSPAFGNFGPQPMDFTAKRLAGGIGYIHFNIWVTPMMEKLRKALQEMKDAPGIIFDVRGNPGGIGGMASGLSGHLFTKETSLGKMQMRSGYTNFVAFPQSFVYQGALVVLTDHGSASTSELFAGGLQDLGRATVVGERTAGAALPSVIETLPTGALFQYAIGDFKTSQGKMLEGRGVTPNVSAMHTRASLLAGKDAQLDAAIRYLNSKFSKRGSAAKK